MIQAFSFSLLTGILWTLVGILFGRAPEEPRKLYGFFAVSSVVYFLGYVLPSMLSGKLAMPEHFSSLALLALIMIPAATAELIGFWLLKAAMNRGRQGVVWAVFQSALIIPFIGCLCLPGGHASIPAWIGIAMILGGLALLAIDRSREEQGSGKEGKSGGGAALFLAFLLSGFSQFMRQLPNFMDFPESLLEWRILLSAMPGLFWWCGLIAVRKECPSGNVWKAALLYGIVVLAGQFFFYQAADAAKLCNWSPAVFPVAIGSCIVLFSLYGAVFRKEKMSALTWAGIL